MESSWPKTSDVKVLCSVQTPPNTEHVQRKHNTSWTEKKVASTRNPGSNYVWSKVFSINSLCKCINVVLKKHFQRAVSSVISLKSLDSWKQLMMNKIFIQCLTSNIQRTVTHTITFFLWTYCAVFKCLLLSFRCLITLHSVPNANVLFCTRCFMCCHDDGIIIVLHDITCFVIDLYE